MSADMAPESLAELRQAAQAAPGLATREMVATHSAMRSVDFADVRKGDRVLASIEGVVTLVRSPYVAIMTEEGVAYQVRIACLDILDRPNPDAELIEGVATAIAASLSGTEDSWRSEARAALAKIRETHTIEPRPQAGGFHA